MATITVSLPDPITDWVDAQVRTGAYASSSAYLADLIRRDRERRGMAMTMDDLRQSVAEARASGSSPRDVDAIFAQAQDLARGSRRG